MNDTPSRPDPTVAALRALRKATDDYIVALDGYLAVLTADTIEGKPELTYLRAALQIAVGARPGTGYGLGTPHNIREVLSRLLGEMEGTS